MKIVAITVLLILSVYPVLAFAQTNDLEFGYRFLPDKLIENSEGIIEIHIKKGGDIVPEIISELTATSLDSSILRVTEVSDAKNSFTSEIKIKALKPGETTIFVAAKGFSPIEIPVEIHGNKLHQEQILIKTVPNTYSLDGPKTGYVSVELADEDKFPVIAAEPVIITLTSSDNKVVSITDKDIIIDKGQYFAYTKFKIHDEGEATIFASSDGMDTVKSDVITVTDDEEDFGIELYLIPEKTNVFSTARSYVIAVLQNGEEPIIAKENVIVNYKITNSNFTEPANSSPNYNQYGDIKNTGFFEIEKGTYWGYTEFSALSGIEDTYTVLASSTKPLSVDSEEIETVKLELLDDKIVRFEALPILATGNKELIGVVYLEDEDKNPILADKDIVVKIESSDEEFLVPEDPIIKYGYNSALVFGKVGHSAPEDLDLHAVVEESNELIEADIFGPEKEGHELKADTIISTVLADTEFPIAAYIEDGDEVTNFPEDANLFASPSEYLQVEEKSITRGSEVILLNAKSLEKGEDTIYFEVDEYETSLKIDSKSMQPSELELTNPETIFVGNNVIFAAQLLDSGEKPVFANKDIEIKIIPKDAALIDIPENVTIKRGEYYTIFEAAPKSSGETEISLLADELQMITSELEIKSLNPDVEITAPEIIEKDDSLEVSIKVMRDGDTMSGSKVEWMVDGGIVQIADPKTGKDGTANVFVIATADNSVKVDAKVSGQGFSPVQVSKSVKINSTSSEFMAFAEGENPQTFQQFEIFGIDPVLIIVPAAIGAVGFMLKKKGMKIKQ